MPTKALRRPPVRGTSDVNTLSNLYPGVDGAIPRQNGGTTGQQSSAGPVRQRGRDFREGRFDGGDSPGNGSNHRTASRAASSSRRRRRRLPHPRHDRNHKSPGSNIGVDGRLAFGRGPDFTGCRRRGHHEHHAGFGDRTDAGNRPCAWQSAQGLTTFCGSSWSRPLCCVYLAAALGILLGRGASILVRAINALAHRNLAFRDHRRSGGIRVGGHGLRLLSRLEGIQIGSHRSPEIRVTFEAGHASLLAGRCANRRLVVAQVSLLEALRIFQNPLHCAAV